MPWWIIPIAAVLGAIWRRDFGAGPEAPGLSLWLFGHRRRTWCVAMSLLFAIPVWLRWWLVGDLDIPIARDVMMPGWAFAIVVTICIPLHFTEGVRFDRPLRCAWRYTWPAMLPLFSLTICWPILFVGPLIACLYTVLRDRPGLAIPNRVIQIDGWTAWCELWVGASSMAAFAALAVW